MTRPSRRGRLRPLSESEWTDPVDGGADGIDWPSGPYTDTAVLDQWKQPVRVATTASITISTGLNAGDTVDGVTLVAGDRVLVKDQSTGSQNGIYVVGTTPERAPDMDDDDEVLGAVVYVVDGTANGGSIYLNTNIAAPSIGVDDITFEALSSSGPGPGGTADGLVPFYVPDGDTWTIVENQQAVFAEDIEIDGTGVLAVDGDLIDLTPVAVDTHAEVHSIIGPDHSSFPGGTTTFLRADGTFATPAGSGTDASPNPNGADDEFTTVAASTPTGWTALQTPTVVDAHTTLTSHLYLKKTATAAASGHVGIYKSWSPAANDCASVLLRDAVQSAVNYQRGGGMFIGEANPLTGKTINLWIVNNGSGPVICATFYTAAGVFSSTLASWGSVGLQTPIYLRIKWNSSTSISYYVSTSGFAWTPILVNHNPGFTVATIGLSIDTQQATYDGEAYFDWIRFSNGATRVVQAPSI